MTIPQELAQIIKYNLKDIRENVSPRKRKEAEQNYLRSILLYGKREKGKKRNTEERPETKDSKKSN